MSASSARVLPASPSRARLRGLAGRSWCWRRRASPGAPPAATPASCCRALRIGADALIERVGLDQAKALWARSEAGAEYVRNAARDMPGAALSLKAAGCTCQKPTTSRAMAHEAALLAGEFGAAVEPWPADRVREVLQFAALFSRAALSAGFCLHPLNYALGLAAAAEAAGARIFEDTPVLEIDPAGVRKRVITQHSRVRAAHRGARRQCAYDGACAAIRRDAAADLHARPSLPRRLAMSCTMPSAIPAR